MMRALRQVRFTHRVSATRVPGAQPLRSTTESLQRMRLAGERDSSPIVASTPHALRFCWDGYIRVDAKRACVVDELMRTSVRTARPAGFSTEDCAE
jgi:hypothetical protein